MKKFREAGINRISLGVQSFDDRFLKLLGRIHTAEESRQAFFDIRKAGFENVSIDLMHSLPGQTLEQWRAELQLAIRLSPEHISVYGLTVEKETPFALRYPKGNRELADDDLSADMFESADELLTSAGFEHYEIANYARPGHKSLHNSGYWKRDGYLGLGVAAHSFLRDGYGVRFSNPENMDEYRRIVSLGRLLRVNEDHLTQDDAMSEYMFLGLRLAEGVALSAFELEFSRSIEDVFGSMPLDLDKFGLLRQNGERISLTLMGMLLSNQVFGRFML
jgi:oxygen-independent coproporphyrinogen-3 oxidase